MNKASVSGLTPRCSLLLDHGDQQKRLWTGNFVFDLEPVIAEGVRGHVGGVPFVERRAMLPELVAAHSAIARCPIGSSTRRISVTASSLAIS